MAHDDQIMRGSLGIAGRCDSLLASVAYERAELPWQHPQGLDDESFLRLGLAWEV